MIDFILHIDKYIGLLATQFGGWSYIFLWGIIFLETGAVILPFLPGDSLLFAAGAVSGQANFHLSPIIFFIGFFLSALAGDNLNFFLGKKFGLPIFGRFIKQTHLVKAENYLTEHGNTSIILARFIPIIRTFVPFVAGVSGYSHRKFLIRSVISSLSWSGICIGCGFFFGQMLFVKSHFSMIVLGIIFVTLLPSVISFMKNRFKK